MKTSLPVHISRLRKSGAQHIYSVDILRFLANFCIVLSHTRVVYATPVVTMHGFMLISSFTIYNICRLALPLFFIFSGFFYGKSILNASLSKLQSRYMDACKRIFLIFIVFIFLYGLIPGNGGGFLVEIWQYGWVKTYYWHFQSIFENPLFLFTRGTKYHLWFLPALILALSTITAFCYFKKKEFLIYVFVCSWIITLTIGSSPLDKTILGQDLYGFLKAIAYVTCGYLLAQKSHWKLKTALKFLKIGVIALIIQNTFLIINHIDIASVDLIGIMPTAVGLLMLALNYPNFGKDSFFSQFGLLTLWIYGVHPFILDQIQPFGEHWNPVVWSLAFPILVYGLSLIIATLFNHLLQIRKSRHELNYQGL